MMCSTDFGVLDLLFDKEDPTCKGLITLDGFKNTLFSSTGLGINDDDDDVDVKEEVLDSGTIDWKLSSEWDADELLRSVLDGEDLTTNSSTTTTTTTCPTLPPHHHHPPPHHPSILDPLPPSSLQAPDDMDSLEDLVGLPFHAVMDSGTSDSGMSSDSSLDHQMSPGSGYSVSSPGSSVQGFSSPDPGHETTSDLSCISDLAYTSPSSFTNHDCNNSFFPPSPDQPIHSADDFLLPDSGFSSPVRQGITTTTKDPIIITPLPTITPTLPTNTTRNNLPPTTTVQISPRSISVTPNPTPTRTPITRTVVTKATTPTPLLKTVTVGGGLGGVGGGQTIVVTQGGTNNHNHTLNNNKGNATTTTTTTAQLVRGPTILKSSGQTSRSILLPVTVKDLNQVRTIKIISSSGGGGVGVGAVRSGVRTVVSTVRTPNINNNNNINNNINAQSIRTALLGSVRSHENNTNSKSLLNKGGVTPSINNNNNNNNNTRVKLEPNEDDDEDDDDDDDDIVGNHSHSAFQQLTLSDEEKRLLKKEGILLPTHYPLTKQEERELKRIRRKIRNKISAQDSRKRKKEYIDGLEDRVKACTEENQQLQKRIKSLEAQNETLLHQMRRFQTAVTGGSSSGRLQTHASTALMMLILSAALFIVPAVRQDGKASTESEMSLHSSKLRSAGHSRSLLEAGNVGVSTDTLDVLESVEDDVAMEVEIPLVEALNDHDYTPVAKKQRLSSSPPLSSSNNNKMSPYFVPPLDDFPPRHGKPDTGGGGGGVGGFPPDHGGDDDNESIVAKMAARIMDSMLDQVTNNYSDPGGKHHHNNNNNNNNNNGHSAVVVKLGQHNNRKRLRDDIELE